MKLEQKYAKVALDYTKDKMEKLNVEFEPTTLNRYLENLKKLTAKGVFDKGLSHEDRYFAYIAVSIEELMDDAVDYFEAQPDTVKHTTSVQDYVMAAYDYLTCVTLAETKLTNLPYSPFTAGGKPISCASKLIARMPDKMDTSKSYFDNQRGKDAKEISGQITSLVGKVMSNGNDFESVAELYAEYKALSERQKNHTGIWRFFHKNENLQREALLNTMKTALESRLPNKTIDLTKEPSQVYKECEDVVVRRRVTKAVEAREQDLADAFGYREYVDNPELLEAYEANLATQNEKENEVKVEGVIEDNKPEPIGDQLKEDLEEKVVVVTDKVQEPPVKDVPTASAGM